MILGIPWTAFVIILFIFFSGYMAYRSARSEKLIEEQFIEQQGKIYIERMEEEKKRRRSST